MQGPKFFMMLDLVLLTIMIIWGLPKLTKVVPASLTAIMVVSAIKIGIAVRLLAYAVSDINIMEDPYYRVAIDKAFK